MYDVICVGFGPANIALAIALEELWPMARVKFLEKAPRPYWQPVSLIDGVDIRNDPVRDLVTQRNPGSRYTFVNYLHEHGPLFKHLNRPGHIPLRKEYACYLQWVAENVSANVDYGQEVTRIALGDSDAGNGARLVEVATASGRAYRGRSIVVAPERSPYLPPVFMAVPPPLAFHTSEYLHGIADLDPDWTGTIAVVGASQSAVEVVLDLIVRFPAARVINVISGSGYQLKDISPFSEEIYFPEFVDYYDASAGGNGRLRQPNHFSGDRDVIDALYRRIYGDELDGHPRATLRTNRLITRAEATSGKIALELTEHTSGARERLTADRVLLATGYRDLGARGRTGKVPPPPSDLAKMTRMDANTPLSSGIDYGMEPDSTAHGVPPIYVNRLCDSPHRLGDACSFDRLALRSEAMVRSLRRCLTEPGSAGPYADLVGAGTLRVSPI